MAKLQKLIFAGIIVFLPSQLGLHFWPNWAFINGVRVDYFSPTLYFTDVLILILVILERAKRPRGSFKKMLSLRSSMTAVFIILFVALNTYFSYSPAVTIYKWLKVAELGFLAWYVAKNKPSLKLLIIPIIYSCVLAVWQMINQGSVGGLWYWLGERAFTFDTPGIAPWRPYATFSHPNILAGFLVVSTLLFLRLGPQRSEDRKVPTEQGSYLPQIYRIITVAMIAGVLFLTLSKGDLQNGWNLRMQLNAIAIQQFATSPLIGTGLGTSPLYPRNITNYALLHQPIHNIFLLVLSETGVFGLLGFLVILKKHWNWFLIPILALGLFDHYWLTQQQTSLLLALVLGLFSGKLILSKKSKVKGGEDDEKF